MPSSGTSTSRSQRQRSSNSTDDPRIEASTVARTCPAAVEDESVEALAVRPAGTAPPVVVSGRLPASASEIALGARLARRLDAQIGDLVRFSIAGGDCETAELPKDVELTVVGVAVPPVFGDSDIGHGAIVTLDAVAAAGGERSTTVRDGEIRRRRRSRRRQRRSIAMSPRRSSPTQYRPKWSTCTASANSRCSASSSQVPSGPSSWCAPLIVGRRDAPGTSP